MTYVYDNWHNVISATSAEGIVYTLTYDVYGNNLSVKIGNTITSSASYDEDGRITSATQSTVSSFTY